MSGYVLYYGDPLGSEFQLNDNNLSFLKPNGMRGFQPIKAEVAGERRPYRSGVYRLGQPYTPARDMEIALQVLHDSHDELVAYLAQLRRNLNPYKAPDDLGYLRVVTPDGRQRKIDSWCVDESDPELDGPCTAVVVPRFWAPYPFFYDPEANGESFALSGLGGLLFPADFDIATGLPFGESDINSHSVITNGGDVETWPLILIHGAGSDPTIENETTGKTMALTLGGGIDLEAGDYVTIDMANATITFYDSSVPSTTSIIEKMSDPSEFYTLAPGDNTLHVTMTGVSAGSIVVTWYDYFTSGL